MTTFFIDLWHDLREKRLWPAAVALLAGIVAVPAVLFKPASDAPPPSATTPKGGHTPTLPVVHVDSGPSMGSHLEAFSASEKNPFKPMKDLAKTTTPAANSTATSGGTPSSTSTSKTTGTSGGGGGTPASTSPGSGGGTTPKGGTTSTATKTTKRLHYVADFSFGEAGQQPKHHKGVATYTLLPDETTPVVVFLGI